MSASTRRAHPRTFCEAGIRYAPADKQGLVDSHAYNYSPGGLYLESSEWFPTNTHLRILMKGYDPGASGPEAYRSYIGNIRWRQKLRQNGGPKYGFGVQFLERHHSALDKPVRVEWVACDVCGEFVKREESRLSDDLVRMCGDCCLDLGCMPDGKLNDCIQRFLTGNIF